MTTLTLQIENPSVLTQLKDVLKAFRGVKIIDSASDSNISVNAQEDEPNAVTLAAMKEVESGKDAGPVCMDNLERFIASMQ